MEIFFDQEFLGYEIGLTLLSVGMYFASPVMMIMRLRK
jgi:hypothetical protein